MVSFILRRLGHTVVVLLLVSLLLAFLLDLTPGDPAFALLGEQATAEQVEVIHQQLGLDDPLASRYGRWLIDVVSGDFGRSYITNEPVGDQIIQRLPVTAEIALLTLLLSLLVAVPIGMYTAYRVNGVVDRGWAVASSALLGSPAFVTALLLVALLAIGLQDAPVNFPVTGWVPLTENLWENLRHVALPVFTLTLALVPQYARVLRTDMIRTLQEDYVLAARMKGLSTMRVLTRHALRPSLFSLVTLAGISLGQLIGGAVIVEVLFALPGIGSLIVQSINGGDVLSVQGVVMFVAVVYVLVNAALEVLYGLLDPRVREASA